MGDHHPSQGSAYAQWYPIVQPYFLGAQQQIMGWVRMPDFSAYPQTLVAGMHTTWNQYLAPVIPSFTVHAQDRASSPRVQPGRPRSRTRSRSRPPSRARTPVAGPIYFYNRGEPYYEFTNFANYSVWHDGRRFPTSEHLFQALKFEDTDPTLVEHIRAQPTPRAALQEATRHRGWQRRDWYHVNIGVMERVVEAKFRHHEDLREMLLATGDRELIEDSPVDSFWGCGADRQGRNELGKCLMRVREKLREERLHGGQ